MKSNKKTKLKFIVLIGPPCAGKTFWRNNNVNVETDVVLSNDDIMLSLCETPENYNECWKNVNKKTIKNIFNSSFDNAIKENKNIIVDTTNIMSKRRKKLLARVGKNYEKIAILFEYDRKVLLERNENRNNNKEHKKFLVETIDHFIDNFQPINKAEEGFDKIISIKLNK